MGGTQIGKGKTVYDPEEAATQSWAQISSGGGFSLLYDAPKYQRAAVSQYFVTSNNASNIPYFENGQWEGNDGYYNRNGRGFPDISASKPIYPLCRVCLND